MGSLKVDGSGDPRGAKGSLALKRLSEAQAEGLRLFRRRRRRTSERGMLHWTRGSDQLGLAPQAVRTSVEAHVGKVCVADCPSPSVRGTTGISLRAEFHLCSPVRQGRSIHPVAGATLPSFPHRAKMFDGATTHRQNLPHVARQSFIHPFTSTSARAHKPRGHQPGRGVTERPPARTTIKIQSFILSGCARPKNLWATALQHLISGHQSPGATLGVTPNLFTESIRRAKEKFSHAFSPDLARHAGSSLEAFWSCNVPC